MLFDRIMDPRAAYLLSDEALRSVTKAARPARAIHRQATLILPRRRRADTADWFSAGEAVAGQDLLDLSDEDLIELTDLSEAPPRSRPLAWIAVSCALVASVAAIVVVALGA
jgi:hypothetical protein